MDIQGGAALSITVDLKDWTFMFYYHQDLKAAEDLILRASLHLALIFNPV